MAEKYQSGGKKIYSLLGTAKLYDLNAEAYLREVLSRMADTPSTASSNSCPGSRFPICSINIICRQYGQSRTLTFEQSVPPSEVS